MKDQKKSDHIIVKGLQKAEAGKGRIIDQAHEDLFKSHCELLFALKNARNMIKILLAGGGLCMSIPVVRAEIEEMSGAIDKAEKVVK